MRIVGQGLAGSLVAWACERKGLAFEISDPGHASASSRVGAGIINPITGQRIVKSWRVDELLPKALQTYREIEKALGEPLIYPLRVRRFCRSEHERQVAAAKQARGELDPYVVSWDEEAFWIEDAYRIDLIKLIDGLRRRWISSGNLVETEVTDFPLHNDRSLTIWCTGAGELRSPRFAFARLQAAKGEILEVAVGTLTPGVILNDGHWVLPLGDGRARVGATFERAFEGLEPTQAGRDILMTSACRLIGADFQVTGQTAGIRVTTSDKRPVVGRHPQEEQHGILNGLGSKGALLAPWLAEQWAAHLTTGAPFDVSVEVGRFAL